MTDSSKEPSKGAWTPGPWEVEIGKSPIAFRPDAICLLEFSPDRSVIVKVSHRERVLSGAREADAMLISKAPVMAEMWADLIEAAGDQKLPLWLVGRLHAAKCLLTDLYPNEEKGSRA